MFPKYVSRTYHWQLFVTLSTAISIAHVSFISSLSSLTEGRREELLKYFRISLVFLLSFCSIFPADLWKSLPWKKEYANVRVRGDRREGDEVGDEEEEEEVEGEIFRFAWWGNWDKMMGLLTVGKSRECRNDWLFSAADTDFIIPICFADRHIFQPILVVFIMAIQDRTQLQHSIEVPLYLLFLPFACHLERTESTSDCDRSVTDEALRKIIAPRSIVVVGSPHHSLH